MAHPSQAPATAAVEADTPSLELTVVMPCLNEADTLATCIRKALTAMREAGIAGEVVVADNGSTDGSIEIAEREGARVVAVTARGYGSALMGGIESARGQFVLMGDADDSYDFLELPKFIMPLRDGAELVMGCRLPSGGGRVLPGAMPLLHRWWGNPMFTGMVRIMFGAPIHDVYCGLRGFRKEFYHRLDLRCTGMEFATEMVIKASLGHANIAEVPITLHPDGRKAHAPHLKTFRDGWRTLRFFLLYSPKWLFLVPGLLLMLAGAIGYGLALPGVQIGTVHIDAHSLLVASLALLLGYQAVLFAISAKIFAIRHALLPPDPALQRFARMVNLERCLVGGSLAMLGGLGLLIGATVKWWQVDLGELDYAQTMRLVIPGVTLVAGGVQTVLGSFFISILNLPHR